MLKQAAAFFGSMPESGQPGGVAPFCCLAFGWWPFLMCGPSEHWPGRGCGLIGARACLIEAYPPRLA